MIKVEFHVDPKKPEEGIAGLNGETAYEGDIFQLTAELIQVIDDLTNRVGKDDGEDGTLRELVRAALEAAIGVNFEPDRLKRMRDLTMALSFGGSDLPSFWKNKNEHIN